jgi:hypothetical protein
VRRATGGFGRPLHIVSKESAMETWYVMADGSYGDPAEIGTNDDGTLMHRDGRAVAYGPHGPKSRGMSADEIAGYRGRALVAAPAQPGSGYKTRRARA